MHDVPLRISIHAPRTGSDMDYVEYLTAKAISIHAPRTGSDAAGHQDEEHQGRFQSTLPARGATVRQHSRRMLPNISIHAPRTGSDQRTT